MRWESRRLWWGSDPPLPAAAHALLAADALETYGRARHQAGLNYGDSFAYALAKATGEPLLFKGDDFAKTDVVAAAY